MLERAGDLGGTWQANTYPGCACDVPFRIARSVSSKPGRVHRNHGIDPEIARMAAEGRRPDPPKEVDRETPTAEMDGRGKQRERGIGLDR
ncbi:hypothetical protein [Nocardia cyriacigeorgica]|uniref:hypothetical protein n=1 Tax=Nocardia cyriacigeorgica TaxID=135487 RepID=UPI0002D33DD2|nr:hypothetical protein [Nocardia cyriacigeorgica]TLF57013.1 hypothetical protein FEK31_15320 [Nocardia cyriacigeorgica]